MQGQTSQRQAKKESKRHGDAVCGTMLQLGQDGRTYVCEGRGWL